MDVFNFCWISLLDESKKSHVFFDKNTCNVRDDIYENFNKPLNRISYIYKFGSYNISFFQKCFQDFCIKVPSSQKIIDNLRSLKNITICSMSAGPGTDIIGLLYSLSLINKPLTNAVTIKVISRHGAWRNLVTGMINSSIIEIPEGSTSKLIECDFLKGLSEKAQSYIKSADILLLCNSFSSSLISQDVICNRLRSAIQLLKPGALVFFIFGKEKSTFVKELFCYGSFLYGPVEVSLENMPYNEKIVELVGVKPLCSGISLFSVWQKHEIKQEETKGNLVTADNRHCKSDLIGINSQTMNMVNLSREFSRDINFSSRISLSPSNNSVNVIKPNIVSSDINFNNVKYTSSTSLGASDSLGKKEYELPGGTAQKKIRNDTTDMSSLLKNFETLVTKLEGLISSRDSFKDSDIKEHQPSGGLHCPQSMHQVCRCPIKSCSCCETVLTCSSHSTIYSKDTSVGSHSCCTGTTQTLNRTISLESPSLVIPLQSLSNESLAHILSIVSQNTSASQASN